jgi:invasion protein IalB
MPNSARNIAWLFAGALVAAGAANAAAQQGTVTKPLPPRPPAQPQHTVQSQIPPAAPVTGDTPQSTTATYGDWIVQCQTQAGPPPQKACDMTQIAQVQQQGKNTPFSRIAIVHPTKGQPVRLVVQLPINVSFASSVRIQTGDADPGITAPFARCIPAGCFADFDLKVEVMKKLRAAGTGGKLTFADSAGHDVSVPLSFNGFSQGFEALAKE